MTPLECSSAVKKKFASIYKDDVLWKDVLQNLTKKESSFRLLRKARANALGLTDSLVSHHKDVGTTEGKIIARKMQKEMVELIKVKLSF